MYPGQCHACGVYLNGRIQNSICDSCRATIRHIESPFCSRCGLPFTGNISIEFQCENCTTINPAFDSARSAVYSNGVVREIIHQFKYGNARHLELFLGLLLMARAVPELEGRQWNVVMPVPLHPVRERERGCNQSSFLASMLAENLGVPFTGDIVSRVKNTDTQSTLGRDARLKNMRGAFIPAQNLDISGQSIIIVDDVMTTGATVSACAKALKQAGADHVIAWTVARGGLGADLT